MLKEIFTKLFKRIAAITEGTRNEIDLHQKLYLLQGEDRLVATEAARVAIVRRLLTENPEFHVFESFYIFDDGQARGAFRKILTDGFMGGPINHEKDAEADAITSAFFEQFQPGKTTFLSTLALSNASDQKMSSNGMSGPLTDSTFETSLIAIDNEKMVYVVAGEED